MCFAPIVIAVIFYAQLWLSPYGLKNDVREATNTWMEVGGYRSHTLVQEWAAGTFHYYFHHSPVFSPEAQKSIITMDARMRMKDKDTLLKYLTGINVFTYPELYYVGNILSPGPPDKLEMIIEIFKQQGYDVETVKELQQSIVLRMTKAS